MTSTVLDTPATKPFPPRAEAPPQEVAVPTHPLQAALRLVGAVLPRRPTTLAVQLGHVRLLVRENEVVLTAYTFETTLRLAIPVIHPAGRDFACLVSLHSLAAALRDHPAGALDSSTLTLTAGALTVRSGDLEMNLPIGPLADWSVPPEIDAPTEVYLDGGDVESIAQRGCLAAGVDETLPILTGVHLSNNPQGITAATTDRYRLAILDVPCRGHFREPLLVPAATMALAGRLFRGAPEVQAAATTDETGRTLLVLRTGSTLLVTRCIEGEFPSYQRLTAAAEDVLATSRFPLARAVTRVRYVARACSTTAPVTLTLAEGKPITLSGGYGPANGGFSAKASLDGEHEGPDLTVHLDPRYLLHGLGALTGETVSLSFQRAPDAATAALRPVVLRGDNNRFLYLLMPVRTAS